MIDEHFKLERPMSDLAQNVYELEQGRLELSCVRQQIVEGEDRLKIATEKFDTFSVLGKRVLRHIFHKSSWTVYTLLAFVLFLFLLGIQSPYVPLFGTLFLLGSGGSFVYLCNREWNIKRELRDFDIVTHWINFDITDVIYEKTQDLVYSKLVCQEQSFELKNREEYLKHKLCQEVQAKNVLSDQFHTERQRLYLQLMQEYFKNMVNVREMEIVVCGEDALIENTFKYEKRSDDMIRRKTL